MEYSDQMIDYWTHMLDECSGLCYESCHNMNEDIDEDPIEQHSINPGLSVRFYKSGDLHGILTRQMLSRLLELRLILYSEEKNRWGQYGRDLPQSWWPKTEKDILRYFTKETDFVSFAFFHDQLIGFASAKFADDGILYFDEDCIDPKYRKLGAGTMLTKCLADGAKSNGVKSMMLDVDANNPASEKQVIRNGFKKFSTKFILTL